ncbi:MAG: hypothetical protein WCW35_05315 [Bacteroidota bacterium]
MKYVEIYVKSLIHRPAQETVSVECKKFNLPGLRTSKDLAAVEIRRCKKEYNYALREYQKNKIKIKSLKGDMKSDMSKRLKSSQEHLNSLLHKIGVFTPSERVHGFEEVNDAE